MRMKRDTKAHIGLALLSGALLGFSYPPSPLYSLAYVGLIPFLYLIDRLDNYKQVVRYTYLSMFVFHVITLYWIGGFTHGKDTYLIAAGIALLIAHPMFYWIPSLLYVFIRRRLNHRVGLIAFPFLWIGYEYSHSLTDFSFPWITLGNSQAYDLVRIQIAEYTSVYGISLLVLLFNVIAYWILVQIASKKVGLFSPKAVSAYVLLLGIYLVPWFWGKSKLDSLDHHFSGEPLRVGVVQPNIDPWEKWGEGWESKWESYDNQFRILLSETNRFTDPLDLIVWPETAIPFYILLPQNRFYLDRLKQQIIGKGIPIFTGIPHALYYDSASAPPTARRTRNENQFVEYFNSATLFGYDGEYGPIYKKIVLVPFAERVPFAETLTFLIEPLKWGVGISGWGKGKDTLVYVLKLPSGMSTHLSGMICYESVYPNFVRHFVRQGAEVLLVITNDSWWGNTSGAYQHVAFASFRAIENRRWIVRAANGGISGFIDPYGRIHDATEMYSKALLQKEIKTRRDVTFYTRHGDVFAMTCSFIGIGFIILGLVTMIRGKRIEKE